jgi:hypothetical protein
VRNLSELQTAFYLSNLRFLRCHCSVDQHKHFLYSPSFCFLQILCSLTMYEKGKAVPLHAMEALGGRRYSSYSFTTSALDWGEWSASRPGRALPPGKEPPVPIGEEAGWAPEPIWTQRIKEKFLAPAGDRTPIARSSSP